MPYEVAMALADGPAEAQLEALDILDGLGARPLGDRIRNSLRSLGVDNLPPRPTERTLANPARLTDRQVEVLALIAEVTATTRSPTGCTSPEDGGTPRLRHLRQARGHHESRGGPSRPPPRGRK